MDRRIILSLLALVGGCGQGLSFHQNGGWTYINAPGLQPTLMRDFDQPPGKFSGTCDKNPAFLVMGGDWRRDAKQFTVSTGAARMAFENYGGPAGVLAMLPEGTTGSAEEAANQQRLEAMLANASAPIEIATDNGWTRSVPASPEIGRFVAACHAWRKDHPATD